jgi:hypothetical protein
MGQILLQDNIPDLVIATTTTITMAATYLGKDTRITIGGQQYRYTSTTTINFATTGINALDTGTIASNTLYYIYAVVNGGGTAGLVASTATPTTGPTGYTRWKEIGRCRTLSTAATLAAVANRDGGVARKLSEIIETVSVFTLFAVTTAPTPGTGATYLRTTTRDLEDAIVHYEYRQGNAGTAGTGGYLLPIATNMSINYNKVSALATSSALGTVGIGRVDAGNSFNALTYVRSDAPYTNRIGAIISNDTVNLADWGGSTGTFANASVNLSLNARIPIIEWQGLYT